MRRLFFFIQGLFLYLFLVLPAFATEIITPSPVIINPCDGTQTGIASVICSLGGAKTGVTIRNIIVFIVILAVVFALLYLLYGGVKWITSKGEKTEVEAARNHIVAALTGLILVILAVFILSLILAAFGIDFANLQIPTIGTMTK